MKQFLVSKDDARRLNFVRRIKGKKIAIYNYDTPLLKEFDVVVQMNDLMKNDIYLERLAKMDGETSVVLIDVLVKHGVYVHPYGKIYSFTEQANKVFIIDTFAFKFSEKAIFRPFLFINPDILGHSLSEFYNEGPFKDFNKNTIEHYYIKIKPWIEIDTTPLNLEVIRYEPSKKEITQYNQLKKVLIDDPKNTKPKIVTSLIKLVDDMESKKEAAKKIKQDGLLVYSNKPKNKFDLYEKLRDDTFNKVYFLSSGTFGADEIELDKTLMALNRHNELIRLLNG